MARPGRRDAAGAGARRFDKGMSFCDHLVLSGEREWAAGRAAGRVLELGAGTGRNAAHLPAGTKLLAVDLDEPRLVYARERSPEIVPVCADMTRLPFAAGSFDTVLSTFTFCEVSRPEALVAELSRVLAPGGRVVMVEHVASAWWSLRWAQRALDLVTVPTLGEHFTRSPVRLLLDAGFELVDHSRRFAGIIERLEVGLPGAG
jgi:ubiquinone/menaquinone biosynthesis C-methylase UbiE